MSNNTGNNDRRDQSFPQAIKFNLGFGAEHLNDTMWRCEVLRAGKLYSRSLFGSKAEADEFARQLGAVEPDHTFRVESIKASAVWN